MAAPWCDRGCDDPFQFDDEAAETVPSLPHVRSRTVALPHPAREIAPVLRIRPEQPLDLPVIEDLLDRAFGLRRRLRISYRYRIGIPPVYDLCLVAETATGLVGSIRYWPIRLDGRQALLLGPLAIEPALRGRGIGAALVDTSLARAAAMGSCLVFLVGDCAYYARFGFAPAPPSVIMPGEDPARLLLRRLDDTGEPLSGVLLRADAVIGRRVALPEAAVASLRVPRRLGLSSE